MAVESEKPVDPRLTEILAEVGAAVADMVAERETIAEQLSEMNAALADMVGAVEYPGIADQLEAISKSLDRVAESIRAQKPQAFDFDALGRSLASALTDGIRAIPQPVLSIPAPVVNMPREWKSLDVSVKRTEYGVLNGLTINRVS